MNNEVDVIAGVGLDHDPKTLPALVAPGTPKALFPLDLLTGDWRMCYGALLPLVTWWHVGGRMSGTSFGGQRQWRRRCFTGVDVL